MNPIKITIVIPTRERCETLKYSLQTCTSQSYENLEIIVSDNQSQDDTRTIVDSCGDSRVRYINTGKRVGMSANWEFALSHVKDGYVTFIGDDDGFLPNSIQNLAELLTSLNQPQALAWGRPVYNWPSHVRKSLKNTLFFHNDFRLLHLNSAEYMQKIFAFQCPWASLPSIYNGVIQMDTINIIRNRTKGRFFHSAIPDVYSAIAIASVLPTYYFSQRGFSVAGISAKSNGSAFSNIHTAKKTAALFLTENEIAIHPDMVMSAAAAICTAECFLQAKSVGLIPASNNIDLKMLIHATLRESSEEPLGTYLAILDNIREIGRKNGLENFAEEAIRSAQYCPSADLLPISAYDIRRKGIVLNGYDFGVENIYQATLLCDHMMNKQIRIRDFPVNTVRLAVRNYTPAIQKRLKRWFGKIKPNDIH